MPSRELQPNLSIKDRVYVSTVLGDIERREAIDFTPFPLKRHAIVSISLRVTEIPLIILRVS